MKVVLDTNVLVSALVFPGGVPDQLVDRARAGDLSNVTSPELLDELRRVLGEKFRYTADEVEAFVDRVRVFSEIVYPTRRVQVVTRKDADNRVLEAAAAGAVDWIITGDRHDLLPLGAYEGIPIIAPADALAKL